MLYLKKFLFVYFIVCAALSFAQINIRVINNNPDFNDSNTFLRFESEPTNLSGTIAGEPLVAKTPYSFAQAKDGINLNYDIGGRIFFSLGDPLDDPSIPPEPNNPSIASYYTRFDKIELTYSPDNVYSVANLTIIDFFSIPLCLKTYKNGVLINSLDLSVDGETMKKNLARLTDNNPQAVITEQGQFLRVLGPPNSGDISDLYPSMKEYIDTVKASSLPFHIQDHYYHNGETAATQTQEYSFFGSINPDGDLILQGGGDVIQGDHTIKILHDDLLQGIYGCNPDYFVDDVPSTIGQNDVYSAVVRDTVAGFNLGFIGSTTINPATGRAFNVSPSCEWWQSPKAFEFAQPIKPFYNQWGRYISENSNSYSFPFSDMWKKVQISLYDVDTLEIIIKPDSSCSHFFSNLMNRAIPRAVNKILGIQIKKTG